MEKKKKKVNLVFYEMQIFHQIFAIKTFNFADV